METPIKDHVLKHWHLKQQPEQASKKPQESLLRLMKAEEKLKMYIQHSFVLAVSFHLIDTKRAFFKILYTDKNGHSKKHDFRIVFRISCTYKRTVS